MRKRFIKALWINFVSRCVKWNVDRLYIDLQYMIMILGNGFLLVVLS